MANLNNPSSILEIIDTINGKQDTLISGTTIKTINNESLLGSGNITISGGGGTATDVQINGTSITSNNVANIVTNTAYDASSNKIATMSDIPANEVFIATYGTTTYNDIKNAYNSAKFVFVRSSTLNACFPMTYIDNSMADFCGIIDNTVYKLRCHISRNTWSTLYYFVERTSNKTTSLSSSSTDTQYPSAKATYNTIIANTPIGAIIPFTCSSSYTPDNCLPCDGTQYSKSQFNAFYTNFLANGNLETCTFADYTTELNTYGSCAKFAIDTTNEVFRVPFIADGRVIQQAQTNAEIGKGYKAGLPNFTGNINFVTDIYSDETAGRNTIVSDSVDTNSDRWCSLSTSSTRFYANSKTIDASLSSPIYGNSTTVQPQAVALRYFVVVANATINQTAMDWSSWATSLSGKANVDLSNINQTAKNTVINTIMPDYANGITYTYTTALTEQSYTMPSDGYFSYTLFSLLANRAVCYIKVNDNAAVEILAAGSNTGNYAPNSGAGLIPVNKNDVVKVLANYASGDVTKFGFFPMKGAA